MRATQTSGKVNQSSITRSKTPSLNRVLKYKNSAIVDRIMKELKLSKEDATVLFQDTLKFLWIAAKFGNMAPPRKVDKGWHVFLLFTMDYKKFCHKYFGGFLHHRPNRPEDAPDGGAMLRRSRAIISEHFGSDLSDNWKYGRSVDNSCGNNECCGRDTCGGNK